jgi:hydrogenase maturation factor HypE
MTFEEEYKICDESLQAILKELENYKKKKFSDKIRFSSLKRVKRIEENLLSLSYGMMMINKQILSLMEQMGAEVDNEDTDDSGMYE